MKRLHLHVKTHDLPAATRFYSALFDMPPTVEKDDYVKWMVEDPRINFAVSPTKINKPGINHVGIQVESDEELAEMKTRLENADLASRPEMGTNCCYANSNKHWTLDPQNVVWEMFHTMGEAKVYGNDHGMSEKLVEAFEGAEEPKVGCC